MRRPPGTFWAIMWHSRNRLDGKRDYVMWDGPHPEPTMFRTREACRAYIEKSFGYIRTRPDLQREPHGWRMPTAVLVHVTPAPVLRAADALAQAVLSEADEGNPVILRTYVLRPKVEAYMAARKR